MTCRFVLCRLLLSGLCAVLLAQAAAVAQDPKTLPRFEPRECRFGPATVPGIECGVVYVPERRDRVGARELRLPLAIFRSEEASASSEPVIYLAGGPGAAPTPRHAPAARGWRFFADQYFPGRDFILFDQRGSGFSYPALACQESENPRVWAGLTESAERIDDAFPRARQALRACRDRLRGKGYDLAAFNSKEIAADVEALRRTLGLEKVVLFGNAYGSRIALNILRDFPDSVSVAILDSALPPNAASGRLNAGSFATALRRLFESCEAHRTCGKVYPDLEARLSRKLARLHVEPLVLEIQNLERPAPLYARIDDVALLDIIFWALIHRSEIHSLPMMIHGLARGEDWRLKSHAEHFYYSYRADVTLGMHVSALCNDEFALAAPRDLGLDAEAFPYLQNWALTTWRENPCHDWLAGSEEPDPGAAVASDVPTLILAGGFDPTAPPDLAAQAAETLANSYLFVIPDAGHEVVPGSPCVEDLIQDFLSDPTRRPEPDCLDSLPPPSFITLGGN